MHCLSFESPGLHCKKRENSTSSDTKDRSRGLQQKPGDAVAFSKRAPDSDRLNLNAIDLDGRRSFSLISQKVSLETALLSERQESDTRCQVVLVARFESYCRSRLGGQQARGSSRQCKVSVQIAENEINTAAYYSNHGKYSFGAVIFEYSRLFEQFVSTLQMTHQLLICKSVSPVLAIKSLFWSSVGKGCCKAVDKSLLNLVVLIKIKQEPFKSGFKYTSVLEQLVIDHQARSLHQNLSLARIAMQVLKAVCFTEDVFQTNVLISLPRNLKSLEKSGLKHAAPNRLALASQKHCA